MKRFGKVATGQQTTGNFGLLNELGSSLIKGLLAGILFQGSFIMFGFQKRVVRGVTANQLEQIRKLETQASQKIVRGEVPDFPLDLLRDSVRERFQKIKQQKSKDS